MKRRVEGQKGFRCPKARVRKPEGAGSCNGSGNVTTETENRKRKQSGKLTNPWRRHALDLWVWEEGDKAMKWCGVDDFCCLFFWCARSAASCVKGRSLLASPISWCCFQGKVE